MVVIIDVQQDLGAGRLGCAVVRIGITHDEIAALRLGAADLIRLLHQAVMTQPANADAGFSSMPLNCANTISGHSRAHAPRPIPKQARLTSAGARSGG